MNVPEHTSLERQRRFWSDYLKRYPGLDSLTTNDRRRTHGRYAIRTVATLLQHVPLESLRHQTVLDYGCGTGRLARFIAPLCGKLICMDVSADMLALAKQNLAGLPNVEFRFGDGISIDLPANAIDFTYSYAALIYMNSEQEFWRIVAEIDRVSRRFSLHLHSQVNEQPDPQRSIQNISEGQIYDVQGYRPSRQTLRRHYPDDHYWVERRRPDVRGREPFFYKGAGRPHGLGDLLRGRLTNLAVQARLARTLFGR